MHFLNLLAYSYLESSQYGQNIYSYLVLSYAMSLGIITLKSAQLPNLCTYIKLIPIPLCMKTFAQFSLFSFTRR
jgi:hypothetical protein